MEDNQYNKELEDSKNIVRAVERGKASMYWQLIEKEVIDREKYFRSILLDLESRGIRDEKDKANFNRSVDNLDHLRWFKGINEVIMKKHLGIIEKFTKLMESAYKKVESFVRG